MILILIVLLCITSIFYLLIIVNENNNHSITSSIKTSKTNNNNNNNNNNVVVVMPTTVVVVSSPEKTSSTTTTTTTTTNDDNQHSNQKEEEEYDEEEQYKHLHHDDDDDDDDDDHHLGGDVIDVTKNRIRIVVVNMDEDAAVEKQDGYNDDDYNDDDTDASTSSTSSSSSNAGNVIMIPSFSRPERYRRISEQQQQQEQQQIGGGGGGKVDVGGDSNDNDGDRDRSSSNNHNNHNHNVDLYRSIVNSTCIMHVGKTGGSMIGCVAGIPSDVCISGSKRYQLFHNVRQYGSTQQPDDVISGTTIDIIDNNNNNNHHDDGLAARGEEEEERTKVEGTSSSSLSSSTSSSSSSSSSSLSSKYIPSRFPMTVQKGGYTHMSKFGCTSSTDAYLVTTRNPIERMNSWFYFEKITEKLLLHPTQYKTVGQYKRKYMRSFLYIDCYTTFHEFVMDGLYKHYDTIMNQSNENKIPKEYIHMTCPQRAWAIIVGARRSSEHNYYNYEYYTDRMKRLLLFNHPNHHPTNSHTNGTPQQHQKQQQHQQKPVFVIRTEYMSSDWDTIETMFGGSGTMGETLFNLTKLRVNHNNADSYEHVKNTSLPIEGFQILCHALCIDIQYYKRLLLMSENLNNDQIQQSMIELQQYCPTEPTYTIRTDCPPIPIFPKQSEQNIFIGVEKSRYKCKEHIMNETKTTLTTTNDNNNYELTTEDDEEIEKEFEEKYYDYDHMNETIANRIREYHEFQRYLRKRRKMVLYEHQRQQQDEQEDHPEHVLNSSSSSSSSSLLMFSNSSTSTATIITTSTHYDHHDSTTADYYDNNHDGSSAATDVVVGVVNNKKDYDDENNNNIKSNNSRKKKKSKQRQQRHRELTDMSTILSSSGSRKQQQHSLPLSPRQRARIQIRKQEKIASQNAYHIVYDDSDLPYCD